MPKADKKLYFVINEKHNTIELTEKGIDLISGENRDYFVMPDLGLSINELDKSGLSPEEKLKQKMF